MNGTTTETESSAITTGDQKPSVAAAAVAEAFEAVDLYIGSQKTTKGHFKELWQQLGIAVYALSRQQPATTSTISAPGSPVARDQSNGQSLSKES